MEKLIKKYNLTPQIGPLRVSYKKPIESLDKAIVQSPSRLHFHGTPQISYDEMFPLQEVLPSVFNLHIFGLNNDQVLQNKIPTIRSVNFIEDVIEYPQLLLVGMHGIILLAKQHFQPLPGTILSPAHLYSKEKIQNHKKDEASIPYCFKLAQSATIAVGYSSSAAATFNTRGNYLMIGER